MRTGSPGQKPPRMLPDSSVGKAAGLERLVNFRKQVRTSPELLLHGQERDKRAPWRQGCRGNGLHEEELQ